MRTVWAITRDWWTSANRGQSETPDLHIPLIPRILYPSTHTRSYLRYSILLHILLIPRILYPSTHTAHTSDILSSYIFSSYLGYSILLPILLYLRYSILLHILLIPRILYPSIHTVFLTPPILSILLSIPLIHPILYHPTYIPLIPRILYPSTHTAHTSHTRSTSSYCTFLPYSIHICILLLPPIIYPPSHSAHTFHTLSTSTIHMLLFPPIIYPPSHTAPTSHTLSTSPRCSYPQYCFNLLMALIPPIHSSQSCVTCSTYACYTYSIAEILAPIFSVLSWSIVVLEIL
jgi:hypothetical protein